MIALAEPTRTAQFMFAGARPIPQQTISEWADEHMRVPSGSAGGEPGRWRTSRTPYLKDIMDCLSPSSTYREVVFMKCAQIGGTSCANNWIGHMIHRAPTSMLIVEPTVDVASKLSKQRIAPMLEEVSCLKGLVKDARSRDSGNTILAKEFAGGVMVMTGANSGVGLRFMSAQNLFLDEVDAYPYDVDGEGPPVSVAQKRTLTYARHKIYKCSTPLLKETSVIEPAYENSDQRKYVVMCPFCKRPMILVWSQVTWPKGKPEEAQYLCEHCQELIPERYKPHMLEFGFWQPQNPTNKKAAGFHLNALYAPYGWVNSWVNLAEEWTDIIHRRDIRAQQTFTNTNLAETWEEQGERIEHSDLWNRREIYPAPVPHAVKLLTASVDTQDDRLEAEAVGWGQGEESWAVDKQVFWGSPGQQDVWDRLDVWLLSSFTHENGHGLKIMGVGIDTGGHHTKEAYEFVRARRQRGVFALKGSSQPGAGLIASSSIQRMAGIRLFSIGTDTAKDTFFSRLRLDTPGPGYCHFPMLPAYDEEHFKQVTAETKFSLFKKGVLVGTYYKKTRARNEALDLHIMNMAVLAILNPGLNLPVQPGQAPHKRPESEAVKKWVPQRKGWLKR